MKGPRVVYLSRGKWGPALLRWLKQHPCDVVYADTENQRVEKFPDYDLGIAFLYGHRIPGPNSMDANCGSIFTPHLYRSSGEERSHIMPSCSERLTSERPYTTWMQLWILVISSRYSAFP